VPEFVTEKEYKRQLRKIGGMTEDDSQAQTQTS
jgi:hypothetical protein